ncbi:MAG: flagellin lysine-N-methylase [Ruminiclostridium sp.]|nr:flagellin lysine-N-methylase [Ruminiclostridium sp.]
MNKFYYQPEYYTRFRCTGGECPQSCCDDWNVFWSGRELDYLRSADMSEELRKSIDENMKEAPVENDPDRYIVKLCDDGRCPFHNRETDLCDIQKEIGSKYFGRTCSLYPRRFYRVTPDLIIRSCTSSCPEVVRFLTEDKNAVKCSTVVARDFSDSIKVSSGLTPALIKEQPYLSAYLEIVKLYNTIFTVIEDLAGAVVFGAFCASQITGLGKNGDSIKLLVPELEKMASDPKAANLAKTVKPDHELKLSLLGSQISFLNRSSPLKKRLDISPLCENDKIVTERYLEGMESFRAAVKDHDTAMRNIAFNIFLDTFGLKSLKSFSMFEYYSYFAMCVTSVQLAAAVSGYDGGDVEKKFIVNAAAMNRGISHNNTVAETIIKILKEADFKSHIEIGLLIN